MAAVTAADVIPIVPQNNMTMIYVEITTATAADTIDLTTVIAQYGSTLRSVIVFSNGGICHDSTVDLDTDIVTIGTGPSAELVTMMVLIE